jgi:signal transduction histidine kinase
VRGKLVAWNIGVLGGILLLVGVGVYLSQSYALDAQVNSQLASLARRELAGGLPLAALQGKPVPTTGGAPGGTASGIDPDADAYQADESPNLFSMVIDLKGHLVSDALGPQTEGLPDVSAARPVLTGQAASTLVTLDVGRESGDAHFRLYSVPVKLNGRLVGALQVGTSLTPRYAELRQFLLLLTVCGAGGLLLAAAGGLLLAHRSLEPARLAFERQRTFVADASHELRTPLSLIRAEAELLARSLERLSKTKGARDAVAQEVGSGHVVRRSGAGGPRDESVARAGEMARDLLGEVDYMNRLISALLQLARIDRGSEMLERELVDLAEVAARTCQSAQPIAAERGLTLSYRTERTDAPSAEGPNADAADSEPEGGVDAADRDADVARVGAARAASQPYGVWGDADRLRELLLILLDNALRYTPSPGTVTVICRREADADDRGGAVVVLEVSDSGPGIAPRHVPHLFDRFYRVDKARSRELGGSGLGLAIGEWIARAHVGTLSVANTPGAGATFRLTLPAAHPSP